MPYLYIQTNQTVEQSEKQALLKKASGMAAELLGKPESYVMVSMDDGVDLLFAGTEEPAAFVELRSIGLPREQCSGYAEKISGFLEKELKLSRSRIFIGFTDLDRGLFALNGKTFA